MKYFLKTKISVIILSLGLLLMLIAFFLPILAIWWLDISPSG